MPASEPTAELVPAFSEQDATARLWSEVEKVLDTSEMFWLSTVRSNRRPHVAPLPAMWLDGKLHFCTGPTEQKAKNIEANPDVALTTGTNQFRSGLDVVVEGKAARVTDDDTLQRLAQMWKDRLDWPYEVRDGMFHDPNDGAGHALVFAVEPSKALSFGKGSPYSQTRYRFPAA